MKWAIWMAAAGAIAGAATGCTPTKKDKIGAPSGDKIIEASSLTAPSYGEPFQPAGSETIFVPFSVGVDRAKAKPRPARAMVQSEVPFLQRMFTEESSYLDPGRGYTPSVMNQNSAAFDFVLHTDYVDWNNLICYDRKGGGSRLLFDRRVVITRFYAPTPPAEKPTSAEEARYRLPQREVPWPAWLMLGVADTDTNHDGYVDSQDAVAVYTADLAGLGLTRLTPPGEQLSSVAPTPDGNSIYLTTRVDADADGKFTGDRDETRLYLLSPADRTTAKPLLSDDVRARAVRIVVEGK